MNTICSGLLMSQLWNPMSCVSHTTVRRFLLYIVWWLVSHIVLPDKWSTYVFLHNLHTSLYSWVIYTHIVMYITIFLSYIYTHIVMLWFEKLFMYMLTNSFITHILFGSSTIVTFIVITNVFIYQRKLCISIGWHV